MVFTVNGVFMITIEILQQLCPKTKRNVLELYAIPLHEVAEYYDMYVNIKRAAAFIAQTAHESGGFNFVKENLNYSADGLKKIFTKYFRDVDANDYHRQPEKIANRVYAGRMGNGPTASGEGWKFRGRGLKQLTGKYNYDKCGSYLGLDLVANPDMLLEPLAAARSAGWFWKTNGLAAFADVEDIKGMTKKINGGFIGLEDREKRYKAVLALF